MFALVDVWKLSWKIMFERDVLNLRHVSNFEDFSIKLTISVLIFDGISSGSISIWYSELELWLNETISFQLLISSKVIWSPIYYYFFVQKMKIINQRN